MTRGALVEAREGAVRRFDPVTASVTWHADRALGRGNGVLVAVEVAVLARDVVVATAIERRAARILADGVVDRGILVAHRARALERLVRTDEGGVDSRKVAAHVAASAIVTGSGSARETGVPRADAGMRADRVTRRTVAVPARVDHGRVLGVACGARHRDRGRRRRLVRRLQVGRVACRAVATDRGADRALVLHQVRRVVRVERDHGDPTAVGGSPVAVVVVAGRGVRIDLRQLTAVPLMTAGETTGVRPSVTQQAVDDMLCRSTDRRFGGLVDDGRVVRMAGDALGRGGVGRRRRMLRGHPRVPRAVDLVVRVAAHAVDVGEARRQVRCRPARRVVVTPRTIGRQVARERVRQAHLEPAVRMERRHQVDRARCGTRIALVRMAFGAAVVRGFGRVKRHVVPVAGPTHVTGVHRRTVAVGTVDVRQIADRDRGVAVTHGAPGERGPFRGGGRRGRVDRAHVRAVTPRLLTA